MILAITREHCRVEDAADFTRLHVTADGLDDAEAGAVLNRACMGSAGEPGHVWLAIGALRAMARVSAETSDWDHQFDAMIAYAGSMGWLDDSGESVTAHIERSAK